VTGDTNEAGPNKKIKWYTAILRQNGQKFWISKVSHRKTLG